MAKIQVTGMLASVEIIDVDGEGHYAQQCSRGAWCDRQEDYVTYSMADIIEAATVHVDFHDKDADE